MRGNFSIHHHGFEQRDRAKKDIESVNQLLAEKRDLGTTLTKSDPLNPYLWLHGRIRARSRPRAVLRVCSHERMRP